MNSRLICLAAAALMAGSCCSRQVTLKTEDGTLVRAIAVNENIIRISAVPRDRGFSKEKSLCVLPQAAPRCTIERGKDYASISTGTLTARISKADGRVEFIDNQGNIISREDRREFCPIEVEGCSALTVRQVFESPDDEDFYGLGQHQADEWNYKGRNEELFQYNTKISVPFIVSSKGYGILWDSYSFCRWGDPRDYAALPEVFRLYDKNGNEGALTGIYTQKDGTVLERRESAINQEYLIEPDLVKVVGAPEDFHFAGSKVCFEGEIEAMESGLHHFLLYYAGYMKVWLDGKIVVPEIWRTAWNPNSRKFQAELEAGKRVPLRIEWIPDGDVSYCGLRALSPVPAGEQGKMSWWGEMQDQIDYYFIWGNDGGAGETCGGTLDPVIGGYRTLTGKAPIMPKWAMGFWQCRERYQSQEQLLGTMAELRRRGIPVDNIVQDWQYWEDDQWGSHEFDASRYPDPKGMIDSVHAMGGRFMISVWPKFYEGTEHFDEMNSRGWLYQTALRDSVEDWLGYRQTFYDAYSEGARKLFWQQMKDHLFCLGVDAWWMDASEPNVHDCTDIQYRKALCGPTALGPSAKYFNAYGLMNAEAIYDGQRSAAPDQRVFLLTRSGFAGLQRYSTASWSGDIGTRWEDMKTQLSAGLNFAMSGIPFWTQDIGGFSVENRYAAAQQEFERSGRESEDLKEWRELNVRWHQMGMFNPLYRSHGQYPAREFWNLAPESHPAYHAMLECDRMRYVLMPYIYTLAARTHFDDYTIMRPLVMDFPADAAAREVSDEFLFGDALLVCPVYKYKARSREVYLPEGQWFDLFGEQWVEGGQSIVADAPYEHIPIFAREGEMVVCGPQIQYTAQPQDGSLTIYVFAGRDADFCLYEDDGVSYAYERSEFSRIPMHWDDGAKTLTIGERTGTYEGMHGERNISAIIVGKDGKESHSIIYNGKEVRL